MRLDAHDGEDLVAGNPLNDLRVLDDLHVRDIGSPEQIRLRNLYDLIDSSTRSEQ